VVFGDNDRPLHHWYAETKLMPHADRMYHGPFDTRDDAERFLRTHVPNWQPGYF
jgi:hypothetical protein